MGNKITLTFSAIPKPLQAIKNPPESLYVTGVDIAEIMSRPRIAVIGSRKITTYGKIVTKNLVNELAKRDIVIVSGLAIGVDALAHQTALETGSLTVAILPNSLDQIYPSSHQRLAQKITKQGLLMTEYAEEQGMKSYKGNFVARNRLVSGLSDAVLITEAAKNSGTLHTARFAVQQGKKVFAVPGDITSAESAGTNKLIQEGAILVTSARDIFNELQIAASPLRADVLRGDNPQEQKIIELLQKGVSDREVLYAKSGLAAPIFSQSLTMLEIRGHVRSLGSNKWALV
jgi:DNA processing protein